MCLGELLQVGSDFIADSMFGGVAGIPGFNFLKHADKDANEVLTFYPERAEFHIWDAIVVRWQLADQEVPEISAFLYWYVSKRPESLQEGEAKEQLLRGASHLEIDADDFGSVLRAIERMKALRAS